MRERTATLVLTAILVLSVLVRAVALARGGSLLFDDEQRFLDAVAIVNRSPGFFEAMRGLFLYGIEHKLFMFISAAYVCAHNALAPAVPGPGWFFAAFSLANIALVYRIARSLRAGHFESLTAAAFMALSSANLVWARHFVPYDIALTLALVSLALACAEPNRKRAFLCGLASACAFFTYYGAWIVAGFGPLVYFAQMLRAGNRAGIAAKTALLAAGFVLPFAVMWAGVAISGHNLSYDMAADFARFSKSVDQGVFAEGWLLPWQYLFAADGWLFFVWLASALSCLIALPGLASGRDRSRLAVYLSGLVFVYGLLALFSTGLHKHVVYGRTARQLLPFLCLTAGFAVARHLGRMGGVRAAVFAAGLAALGLPGLYAGASFYGDAEVYRRALDLTRQFGERDGVFLVTKDGKPAAKFDEAPCRFKDVSLSGQSQMSYYPYLFESGSAATRQARRRPFDPIGIVEYACPVNEEVVRGQRGLIEAYESRIKTVVLDRTAARLGDLARLRDALERFRKDHGGYPLSPALAGIYFTPGMTHDGWIPGLVPAYLPGLPLDPRQDDNPVHQYLYASNGSDFKLIANQPEDCERVAGANPGLADPARAPCAAYGYWTQGARNW